METTTNEIKQRLLDESMDNLMVVAGEMRSGGASKSDIQRMVQNHIRLKVDNFYNKPKEMESVGGFIRKSLQELSGTKADSKAESIFYDLMTKSGIKFQFQYKIGPYRADYLVGDSLVVELDGPLHRNRKEYDDQRDAYMVKKGYHIMRLPLELIAMDSRAVIEGIKELMS